MTTKTCDTARIPPKFKRRLARLIAEPPESLVAVIAAEPSENKVPAVLRACLGRGIAAFESEVKH